MRTHGLVRRISGFFPIHFKILRPNLQSAGGEPSSRVDRSSRAGRTTNRLLLDRSSSTIQSIYEIQGINLSLNVQIVVHWKFASNKSLYKPIILDHKKTLTGFFFRLGFAI
ncbi:MAG: hypothetical protein ACFFD2_05100 [Promethearchaeota archaeon]